MKTVFFNFTKKSELANKLANLLQVQKGKYESRKFPDGETYVNILTDVADKQVIIFASLLAPDDKILELIFLARTLAELSAKRVGIICPYLGYMRQDRKFKTGEALSSKIFAELISQYFDWLITVDPHLHRYKSLEQIYSIPTVTLHAKELLSIWVKQHQPNTYLLGPDEESEQWVGTVAKLAGVDYGVAKKQRLGDRNVEVTFPKLSVAPDTPIILVDDIISSGYTMLEAVKSLKKLGYTDISCLAIHGIFANKIDEKLHQLGVKQIVTSNSIIHSSNKIDLSALIVTAINQVEEIKP